MLKKHYVLVCFAVLLVSNLCTLYFFADDDIKEMEFSEEYPLLNPARSLYEAEDLIVNLQPLREQLNETGKDPNISIYFEVLNTGANISINKDVQIWPASLMKIPIAMAAMKKIENGQWSMDNEFVLEAEDRNPIFGTLYHRPVGTKLTLKQLLDELLINSDNTARNILAKNMANEDFGDVLDYLGVDFDYMNDAQITAKRYSVFWRALFSSTYLEPEKSQKLISIMSNSSAVDFLAQSVPAGVVFSHKIGVLYDKNAYADSGIVYIPNRPYILTVMTIGHNQEESSSIMKDVSEKVYNYVSTTSVALKIK